MSALHMQSHLKLLKLFLRWILHSLVQIIRFYLFQTWPICRAGHNTSGMFFYEFLYDFLKILKNVNLINLIYYQIKIFHNTILDGRAFELMSTFICLIY